MIALAQHVKTLADGTVRFFLRLEGDAFTEPVVVAASAWDGDIILVEKVERAAETAKIPCPVLEMSPSLHAPVGLSYTESPLAVDVPQEHLQPALV